MPARSRASLAKRKGFTLVEVLVAVLITALILSTIFSLFNQYHKSLRRQQNQAEMQQNLRYGFSVLARELAMTGYGFGN